MCFTGEISAMERLKISIFLLTFYLGLSLKIKITWNAANNYIETFVSNFITFPGQCKTQLNV